MVDLSLDTFGSGGWLSGIEGGGFKHEVGASLMPTDAFGRMGGIEWTYNSPSWTPPDTQVDLDFFISMQTRRITPDVLPDPGRDLITFVPEPSSALLAGIGAMALLARRRRPI